MGQVFHLLSDLVTAHWFITSTGGKNQRLPAPELAPRVSKATTPRQLTGQRMKVVSFIREAAPGNNTQGKASAYLGTPS